MSRLKMAENIQAATKMIEQGHVRVGTDTITDPAYLVVNGFFSVTAAARKDRVGDVTPNTSHDALNLRA